MYSFMIPSGYGYSDIFYINGAKSIDRERRVENVDWFNTEQHTLNELYDLMGSFVINKPEIVISHTIPTEVKRIMFQGIKTYDTSRTESVMDLMFQEHQPKIWIFGHFHVSYTFHYKGCSFICLGHDQIMKI